MKIWAVYEHKHDEIALDPRPGTSVGRFEIPAVSEEAAMKYIMTFDKHVKVIGESVIKPNDWHLVGVEYHDSNKPDADVYQYTWAIVEKEVYEA